MDEFLNVPMPETPKGELLLATIGSANASGVTLILDGLASASQKRYKHVETGASLTAGDRVLVVKLSGTYVVLGKITY